MSDTKEQFLGKSPCTGCPNLAWDENYFGNGPIFSCTTKEDKDQFFEKLDGVKKGEHVVYRACPVKEKLHL